MKYTNWTALVTIGAVVGLVTTFLISCFSWISQNFLLGTAIIIFGIILIFFSYQKYRSFFSPVSVFSLGWVIPLGINRYKLSYESVSWGFEMWALVLIPILIFLVLEFILSPSKKDVNNSYDGLFSKFPDPDESLKWGLRLSIIAILSILYKWHSYGIPIREPDYGASTHSQAVQFVEYGVQFVFLANCLAAYALPQVKGVKKLLAFLLILLPIGYGTAQMLRSAMFESLYYDFYFIFLGLTAAGYNMKKIRRIVLSSILAGSVILGAAMPLIGNMRNGYNVQSVNYHVNMADVIQWKGDHQGSGFAPWFYSYYAMGFDNLNLIVTEFKGPFLQGYYLLFPITGPTQIKRLWGNEPTLVDAEIPTLWGQAVGTFEQYLYEDGGMLETLLAPFIYILMIYWIFRRTNRKNSSLWAWKFAYGIFSYGLLFMFFQDYFSQFPLYLESFIMFAIAKVRVSENSSLLLKKTQSLR